MSESSQAEFAAHSFEHQKKPWKIIVIDDEEDILYATKRGLKKFEYLGRPLEFIEATTMQQGKEALKEHDDAAVVFLDVVIPEEEGGPDIGDAGLQMVKYIRSKEGLNNPHIRIIMRTGQPGEAPEIQTLMDYDINDYKSKTELSPQKLFSTTLTSLKNYCQFKELHYHINGLKEINVLHKTIFPDGDGDTEITYTPATLDVLKNIFCTTDKEAAACSGFVALLPGETMQKPLYPNAVYADFHSQEQNMESTYILSALGSYESKDQKFTIPEDILSLMKEACEKRDSVYAKGRSVIYFRRQSPLTTPEDQAIMIYYLEEFPEMDEQKLELLTMYMDTVSRLYYQHWSIG